MSVIHPNCSPECIERPAPRSLGKLVLLANSDRYSRARLDHYVKGQWYLLLLGELVRQGYLDEAELWLISDHNFAEGHEGITVRCFTSFAQMARHRRATDILWIRGDRRDYLPVLTRMQARLWVYYAASKLFIPRHWAPYDLILVDDRRHSKVVRPFVGRTLVEPVLKTTDPTIFRPLPNVKKEFDLCMIGSIDTKRKNYPTLVRLLQAIPTLKVAVVGRNGDNVEQELGAPPGSICRFEFCEREVLNRIMNQSRAGFVPSLQDASPRVILEYIAAGVPLILNANIFGGRDYITPETGILAREDQMPAAVRQVTSGKQSFNPRRIFDERFSPTQAAKYFGTLLDRAIQHFGRGSPCRPPSFLRRFIARPWLVGVKLEKCWRELDQQPTERDYGG